MSAPQIKNTPKTVSLNATRQRIIDATLVCLDRKGLEKTSLHDIAREAGVTRPTVYSHFGCREEVIQAAMANGSEQFGIKLLAHVQKFNHPKTRLLEAVFFAYKNVPKEPYLNLVTDAGLAQMINEQAISSPVGLELCRMLFREILQHNLQNDLKDESELDEIIEVTARFLLSLLLMEGTVKRNDKQMRDFLERRLLPALGF